MSPRSPFRSVPIGTHETRHVPTNPNPSANTGVVMTSNNRRKPILFGLIYPDIRIAFLCSF